MDTDVGTDTPFSPVTRSLLGEDCFVDPQTYGGRLSKRIQDLEREIRALKTRQNVLPLPNRLPPQLLSQIFLLYSGQWDEAFFRETKNLRWLRITHVCRYWRTVALDCPTLWSDLIFTNPYFTQIMLERSKDSPLLVKHTLSSNTIHDDSLAKALAQSHRLRVVQLTKTSTSMHDIPKLLANMGKKAPILRRLELVNKGFAACELPEVFTLGGSSSLTHLAIDNFNIRLDNISMGPMLTDLSLKLPRSAAQPSWDTFLRLLSQMPSLKVLDLGGVIPTETYASPESTILPIVFSQLRELSLDGPTLSLSNLFRSIQVPNTALAHLNLRDSPDLIAQSFHQCMVNLKATWSNDTLLWKKEVVEDIVIRAPDDLTYPAGSHFEITFHTPEEPSNLTLENRLFSHSYLYEPQIQLTIHTRQTQAMSAVLESLTKTFDFSNLHTISLMDSEIVPRSIFQRTLARLPQVNTLRLTDLPIDVLVDTLDEDPSCLTRKKSSTGEKPARRKPTYFPALVTVELTSVDFGIDEISVGTLATALKRRPKGHRPSCISVEECKFFGRGDKKTLEKAVPTLKVDWDGIEDFSDEEDYDEDHFMYGDSDYDDYMGLEYF